MGAEIKAAIMQTIAENDWEDDPKGKPCSLYLLGRRDIYAIPQPLLSKRTLRIGARSMTRFL